MKSIVISSVVAALVMFSGCSSKEAEVEAPVEVQAPLVKEIVPVETEVVNENQSSVMDSNNMDSSDSNEMNMANLEKEMLSVYFDFDKFDIRADMQSKVSTDAQLANGAANSLTIKLEGNCDEWGSDEYNFALGLKRASTVKKSLEAEGVNANRITMVSYGESNPTCTDKTQDCWSKNRRVDFKLLP
jgi:peptidoglycan-associated lipoprotein